MYKLIDKDEFYQWDLERKLDITDNSVTEVHFKKFTSNKLYICEVYEVNKKRVVDIPNILFTTPEKFKAYFYCNDLYTKQHASFDIIPRPKPTDYVYTETEVKRYDTLEEQISQLEDKIGQFEEQVKDSATKEYVNSQINSEIITLKEEINKTNNKISSDISKLQEKVMFPQSELILKDNNGAQYKIFIENGKLQMEVVK